MEVDRDWASLHSIAERNGAAVMVCCLRVDAAVVEEGFYTPCLLLHVCWTLEVVVTVKSVHKNVWFSRQESLRTGL